MLDIECSYAFSSRFAPAPTDSVVEDGDVHSVIHVVSEDKELSNPAPKRARRSGNMTKEIEGLNDVFKTINHINNKIFDIIERVNNDNNNHIDSFSTSEELELSNVMEEMKCMDKA